MNIIITESQLKKIILSEDAYDVPWNYPCITNRFGEPSKSQTEGINKVQVPAGDKWAGFHFYSSGRYYREDVKKWGEYFCKGNYISLDQGNLSDVTKGSGIPSVTEQDTTWDEIKNGTKLMRIGSKGPLVKSLQVSLKEWTGMNDIGGSNCSRESISSCDGSFGPKTQQAVKKFQEMVYLKPDGIVGKQVYQMLFSKANSPEFESSTTQKQTPQKQPEVVADRPSTWR